MILLSSWQYSAVRYVCGLSSSKKLICSRWLIAPSYSIDQWASLCDLTSSTRNRPQIDDEYSNSSDYAQMFAKIPAKTNFDLSWIWIRSDD